MKVLAIGASRNIGYYAAISFLQQGHTVYFAVRNPSALENDPAIQPFVASGHAKPVKCDALVEDDLRRLWSTALEDGVPVDFVLFTVGTSSVKFSLTKGFVMDPINLCSLAFFNTLYTCPPSIPKPRVIGLSSLGVTAASHATTTLGLRVLFKMITIPHRDKLGMHRLAAHVSGRPWSEADKQSLGNEAELFPAEWQSKLGEGSWGPDKVIILQAAWLTDGEETKKYRVGGDETTGYYSVSRRDVAHFISEGGLLTNWQNYQGREVSIGY